MSSVNRLTNPTDFAVDGVSFLGSSGEPVVDVRRYSDIDDAVDVMEHLLAWGHLAPSAPDSLSCYPFSSRDDPFVLREQPHVFFAGNQPEFGFRKLQGPSGQAMTVVSVPSFAKTGEVVLVDLASLDCHTVKLAGF